MKKIRVLLADDHAIVRMGLSSLLARQKDIELVGQATNGIEAIRETVRLKPDVVVMDLLMPKKNGADATAEIHQTLPAVKIIILTTFSTSDGIAKAMDNGATGALLKGSAENDLVPIIRKVVKGETALSQDVQDLFAQDPPVKSLSSRQTEILESMARGLTNKEIAVALNITPAMTHEHSLAIFAKLGAANRAEAVAIALRKQLLKI